MDQKLIYKEYEEYPMRLHNYLRAVLLPLCFAGLVALVYFQREKYATDVFLVPECGLCIFGMLLILIAEFGFFYYASYSYYAVLWFMFNSAVLSCYSFFYLYHEGFNPDLKVKFPDQTIDLPDVALLSIGIGVLVWLVWSILVYVYYRRRKFMFVESKENKRMVKGNLKAQEIEFNPQFEREKLSRSELKEHMNKRFENVEGVEQKEESVEADPFEK